MKPARSLSIVIPLPGWLRAPAGVEKDLRVLAPFAFGGFAIMALLRLIPGEFGSAGLFLFPYPIICSALGSVAVGHDFTHRTVGWMLAMPVNRTKVWRQRLLLALILMLPMAFLTFGLLWMPRLFHGDWMESRWILWRPIMTYIGTPLLGGLCLAPWLTLISRSPMFGTIFSMGLPFALSAILERFGKPELIEFVMPLVWIAGLILGSRKFLTLEAIESVPRVHVDTRQASAQRFRRRGAIWHLFQKELLMQRLPMTLALISIGFALLLKEEQVQAWSFVYPVYPAALILLVASIASADERQMGTAEWQVLLPIAYWKQWLMKFTVIWGMALVAGLVIPMAVLVFKTGEWKIGTHNLMDLAPILVCASFVLVVITLYISSLCNSGLKAMLAAMFVVASISVTIVTSFNAYVRSVVGEANWAHGSWQLRLFENDSWSGWGSWLLSITLIGLISLALKFSMQNHQYAERGRRRILRQVMMFIAYQGIVIVSVFTAWNWYTWLN